VNGSDVGAGIPVFYVKVSTKDFKSLLQGNYKWSVPDCSAIMALRFEVNRKKKAAEAAFFQVGVLSKP